MIKKIINSEITKLKRRLGDHTIRDFSDAPFIPLILGVDRSAFGVAASFHQEYGINSVCMGRRSFAFTEDVPFIEIEIVDNFGELDGFVDALNDFANRPEFKGKKILPIVCTDHYSDFMVRAQHRLDSKILTNTIELELRDTLDNKKDFYETCEKYGLKYPKTFVVTKDNYKDFTLPFKFPVIAKPNSSVKYFEIERFEGYKKAYKIDHMSELKKILSKIYENGYNDDFIIQDFIPGGCETMYVVNTYVNSDGSVAVTCGARCLLDECYPLYIGNYTALKTGEYKELTNMVKDFVEKINYRGFGNFDFKYDERDGSFNVFEMNIRPGSSCYYMTTAGANYMKYIVNDLVYNKRSPYENYTEEHLWYNAAPQVVKKFTPDEFKEKVKELFRCKKATFMYEYMENSNLKRKYVSEQRKLRTLQYYPKYFKRDE